MDMFIVIIVAFKEILLCTNIEARIVRFTMFWIKFGEHLYF